jgi:hypothetical protein
MILIRNCAVPMLALALLSGCEHADPEAIKAELGAEQTERQAKIESYAGKEYWVRFNATFPVYAALDKTSASSNLSGKFRIDAFVRKDDEYDLWYRVTYGSGRSGFIDVTLPFLDLVLRDQDPLAQSVYPSYFAKLSKTDPRSSKTGVLVGMSREQVLDTAWGVPDRRREAPKYGRDAEIWYYADNNALYFSDGELYAIER